MQILLNVEFHWMFSYIVSLVCSHFWKQKCVGSYLTTLSVNALLVHTQNHGIPARASATTTQHAFQALVRRLPRNRRVAPSNVEHRRFPITFSRFSPGMGRTNRTNYFSWANSRPLYRQCEISQRCHNNNDSPFAPALPRTLRQTISLWSENQGQIQEMTDIILLFRKRFENLAF